MAGCVEGGDSFSEPRDDNSPIATPTPTPTPDDVQTDASLLSATLRERDCTAVEVQFGEDSVTVLGCVRGNNGCHEPHLRATELTGRHLSVTIASVDTSGAMEACTDVLVQNGYEVALRFDGGTPSSVEIIHDDMDGRRTVATVER